MLSHRPSAFSYLYFTLCLLVLLSGGFSNLYEYLFEGQSINAGNFILFGTVLVSACTGILLGREKLLLPSGRLLLGTIGVGLLLAATYQLWYSVDRVVSIKANISYFITPIAALGAYALYPHHPKLFLRLGLIAGLIGALIGISQYLAGYSVHPHWLVLHGEPILGFPSESWVRPTAWAGNTIFYSALTFLAFMYSVTYYLWKGGGLAWTSTVALASAQYLAMSRYALSASLAWIAVIYAYRIISSSSKGRHALKILCVSLITALCCFVLEQHKSIHEALKFFYPQTDEQTTRVREARPSKSTESKAAVGTRPLIIERFEHDGRHSGGSTQAHISEKRAAIDYILQKNPPKGWGAEGISASRSTVTDGLWFQMGMEVGISGALAFIGWLLLITGALLLVLFRAWQQVSPSERTTLFILGTTLIAYLSYALIGGWVNTSFSGRITYFFFWTFVGLFFAEASRLFPATEKKPVALANSEEHRAAVSG